MSDVTVMRGRRYRLAPTPDQAATFAQFAGVCRLTHNLALEQRETWGRRRRINFATQSRELTALRAQFDWIEAVPRECQDQVLRDLDAAFQAFFKGLSAYPSMHRRGDNDAFRFKGREIGIRTLNAKWSAVRLPKIGWVKFRDTKPRCGELRRATVRRDGAGWYVSFTYAVDHAPSPGMRPAVGIDRGVANTLALSTGELLSVPARMATVDRQRASAQRALARRKRGSNRYAKQRARVAALYARARRIRSDWAHRVSTDIATRFGTVAIENLNVRAMTRSPAGTVECPGRGVRQKAGLNRSILSQGWGLFERFLAYKLEDSGGTLIKVRAAYTSQTCQACGFVSPENRESQAKFRCIECGHEDHADINAAKEILRRSTPRLLVEDAGYGSREARTRGEAA